MPEDISDTLVGKCPSLLSPLCGLSIVTLSLYFLDSFYSSLYPCYVHSLQFWQTIP